VLTDIGVPVLRWLTVTVGDFHGYLTAWCDVLGVSTSRRARSVTDLCPVVTGRCPISEQPVTDPDLAF